LTIVLLVEGDTERALAQHLTAFLRTRAQAEGKAQLRLQTRRDVGRSKGSFQKRVQLELANAEVTGVVALIDVYPAYSDAAEAKTALLEKAGRLPRFYAHAAQHEVKAWLLPYWDNICQHIGIQRQPPGGAPEDVNRTRPPSHHLSDLYRLAKRKYKKTTEMYAILTGKDLTIAANRCPEFKAFLNTLLMLNGLSQLP
jgi:hypothetical protein